MKKYNVAKEVGIGLLKGGAIGIGIGLGIGKAIVLGSLIALSAVGKLADAGVKRMTK
jgi:hypothetical protein